MNRLVICCLSFVFVWFPLDIAADDDEAPTFTPGHWPQWRGPARDNKSTDTGLLKTWREGGPPLLWKTIGLGEGIASVSVAGGRIYTVGYHDGHEFLTALDEETGRRVWIRRIGPSVPESRLMRWLSQRTPTVDQDRLYVMTAYGELICVRTRDGETLWQKSYREDFGCKRPMWGFCDYPMVDGDQLICTPAGPLTSIVGLDKNTGEILWQSGRLTEEETSYSAIVSMEVGEKHQFVNYLADGLVSVSADRGTLLWRFDALASRVNSFTPIVRDNLVFHALGFRASKGALLKISDKLEDGYEIRYVEEIPTDVFQDSTVLVQDHLYLFKRSGMPQCYSFQTGKVAWPAQRTEGEGLATLTYADGHLYTRYSNGMVILVEASPDGYVETGRFEIPDHESSLGATNPVVTGKRLYLRDDNVLLCYDVRENASETVGEVVTTELVFPEIDKSTEAVARGQFGRGRGRGRRGENVSVFVPTPQDVVEKMLRVAGVTSQDLVCDLGCGDGRIVVTAAEEFGARAVGYDNDRRLVELAREKAREAEVESLVTLQEADFFEVDFSDATVVTLYLLPEVNARLIPKLQQLEPGSRIVAHAHPIPGVRPDRVVRYVSRETSQEHTIYLWTAPIRMDGEAGEKEE